MIGHALVRTASEFAPRFAIAALTRQALDLSDFTGLVEKFKADKPQLVIHCAALSKTPACHENPALAWRLNFEVTRLLASLAADVPMYFFSTDLVFDGRKGGYVESDLPNPLSVYAETKVAAEQVILKNPRHTVVRTSLNFGQSPTGDRAFNEEMVLAWKRGVVLRLFVDEFRCPIPARITARAVWELVQAGGAGLFHLAGAEKISRWEIGQLIARRYADLPPRMEAVSIRDFLESNRPPDTSLCCDKIQRRLSFALPGFSHFLSLESKV